MSSRRQGESSLSNGETVQAEALVLEHSAESSLLHYWIFVLDYSLGIVDLSNVRLIARYSVAAKLLRPRIVKFGNVSQYPIIYLDRCIHHRYSTGIVMMNAVQIHFT